MCARSLQFTTLGGGKVAVDVSAAAAGGGDPSSGGGDAAAAAATSLEVTLPSDGATDVLERGDAARARLLRALRIAEDDEGGGPPAVGYCARSKSGVVLLEVL